MQKVDVQKEKDYTDSKEKRIPNSKMKDSSAKLIFGDPVLCSQFLDGYVDIPMLKNISPENIEDVSNRYVHMFTEERNSDVVKKIYINDEDGKITPFYLISLIEHKNQVDYNITMQILRYMVYIWEEYEKEMERKQPGISKAKSFRYPPVLPIIFYDGTRKWTATTQLRDRIILSDSLLKYIPDFDCILVQLRDYSNAELMKRKNELSIVMLIEKLQSADEFKILEEEVNSVYIQEAVEDAPQYLLDIMSQIVEVLLVKLNIPMDEVEDFTGQIKERNMAELFANFKAYDVQAARAKACAEGRAEGLAKGRAEGRAEGQEIGRAEGREEGREEGIKKLVQSLQKHSLCIEEVIKDVSEQYDLTEDKAIEKVNTYWN